MLKRIIYFALTTVIVLTVSSCNDAETDLFDSPSVDGGAGTLTLADKTVSTLTFTWQKVDGVQQYGYTLSDKNGTARRQGVTSATTVTFDNLEHETTYTLLLEAFGANNQPTTCYTITATTDAVRQLATPDASSVTTSIDDEGNVTITWDAVENAQFYDYEIIDAAGITVSEAMVTTPATMVSGLTVGTYTMLLTADTTSDCFTRSETATCTFTRPATVIATFTGKYTSAALGTTEVRTLKQYDDGLFTIEAFYGVEGYDLSFTIGTGNAISFEGYDSINAQGDYVYLTGLLTDVASIAVVNDPTKISYSVRPSGKTLKFNVKTSTSQGVDSFTWK